MNQNRVKPLSSALLLLVSMGATGSSSGAGLEDEARGRSSVQPAQQGLLLSGQELRSGVAPGLCLDVANAGTSPGTNVQIYTCNDTQAQKWTRTSANELRSALAPNLCLAVSNGGTDPGTNVQISSCNGTPGQQWIPTAKGELRSGVAPGLCLDVANAGTSPGTNVQIYTCNSTRSQQWFKVPKLPVSRYTCTMVTISGARFINGTNHVVNVQRGQQFQLTVDYNLMQGMYCPGCIDQILVGLSGESQGQACAYNGIPEASGTSGTSAVTLTAPSTPGVYYVRFYCAQASNCDLRWWTSSNAPRERNDIAVIAVQ